MEAQALDQQDRDRSGLVARLAARAFEKASYDFRSLLDAPGYLLSRPDNNGVSLLVAPTPSLPDDALHALLAWRLGQYLLTGFYDPLVIASRGLEGEPDELIGPSDVHALALDRDGELVTYITLKQPKAVARDEATLYRDDDRPLFPCEEIHGRSWQRHIVGVNEIRLGDCWEVARFVTDQRRPDDPATRRGPLELALASARLIKHPRRAGRVKLVTGDLDPEVALKSLRFFFIPVATFEARRLELDASNALAPRYRDHATAPFLASALDIDYATYIRWADIELALSCSDEDALTKLIALRQLVSLKESSLKRPLRPPGDSPYPSEALMSPSSREASAALWHSAVQGAIPWAARLLGPGDELSRDEVAWVLDGYVQVRTEKKTGAVHLAGMGPEVAFFPMAGSIQDVDRLVAISPVRVLTTTGPDFEAFWTRRQQAFETSTAFDEQ